MRCRDMPHTNWLVDYPGAQVACILGLTDLFGVASTMRSDQTAIWPKPRFALRTGNIHCGARNFHGL